MPKIGQTKCTDKKTYHDVITKLLNTIAKRGRKSRGDIVIAYEEDISVYAVRMWLTRPIPRKHWETVSRLSGFSMDKLQEIFDKYFKVVA
jgi:hypothetical protein